MYAYQFDADAFRQAVRMARPDSQPALARRCCLSRTTIADIEGGTVRPGITAFLVLCRELSLAPSDFILNDPCQIAPGAYRLDMDTLRHCIVEHEAHGKPWPYPQISNRAVSYFAAWRVRRGRVKRVQMGTWLSLCEWLEMPPSNFLEAL